jgi:putative colanic acid biosynthesis acetyltransferase WcaF
MDARLYSVLPFVSNMDLSRYDNSNFDRGAPGWKEALWILARGVFFQTFVPWPSGLRTAILRLFGARIGQNVVIRANVSISFPWRLFVGDYVWIGEDAGLLSLADITIESDVCISQRAYLCTGSHDYQREDFKLVTRPIVIRAGSWIAAADARRDEEIGEGAVVAAGSVVIKDVPPRTLVRGNPAEAVREVRREH